jgi:hypothetical protein
MLLMPSASINKIIGLLKTLGVLRGVKVVSSDMHQEILAVS